jgi:hypothetical protein
MVKQIEDQIDIIDKLQSTINAYSNLHAWLHYANQAHWIFDAKKNEQLVFYFGHKRGVWYVVRWVHIKDYMKKRWLFIVIPNSWPWVQLHVWNKWMTQRYFFCIS